MLPDVLQSKTGTNAMQYMYALGTRSLAQYGSSWEYLLADALGSVRQIVDANGNVTLAESYEPYGSVLSSNGTASSIFAYAGEQVDTSGLVFLRARYMQPTLGIFLARDPWSGDQMRPGSMNGWNYGDDNPVNRVDPTGKASARAALETLALTSLLGESPFSDAEAYIPVETLINSYLRRCSSPDSQGFPSIAYAEGAAAVGNALFGTHGAWLGIETAYNLSTMQRVTFDVRGYTTERLTIFSMGRMDYYATAFGPGLRDPGLGYESQSDLRNDYRGHFYNQCGSIDPTGFIPKIGGWVQLVGITECLFSSGDGRILGESRGVFVPSADFPLGFGLNLPINMKIPVGPSYADLDYNYITGALNRQYATVAEMANDIVSGAGSPFYSRDLPRELAKWNVSIYRSLIVDLLKYIQYARGNWAALGWPK